MCSKLVSRVILLAGGHCSIMDGIYGGLGECISYGVVLALDMTLSEKPLTGEFLMDSVKNNETKETAVE